MNRLLVFVLGIALGAAGMYALYWSGRLPLRSPVVGAQAPPRTRNPGFEVPPAPSEPETLPAPPIMPVSD